MNLASSINDRNPSRELDNANDIIGLLRTATLDRAESCTTATNELARENRMLTDRVNRLETEQGDLRNRILQLEERLINLEAQQSWHRGQSADTEAAVRTMQRDLDELNAWREQLESGR